MRASAARTARDQSASPLSGSRTSAGSTTHWSVPRDIARKRAAIAARSLCSVRCTASVCASDSRRSSISGSTHASRQKRCHASSRRRAPSNGSASDQTAGRAAPAVCVQSSCAPNAADAATPTHASSNFALRSLK
jgi:hypothetical protein